MAITVLFDIPGGTQQQYDDVIKALGEMDLAAPAGRLSHVASPRGDGWFVVDVWDSAEEFGRFGESLLPILQRVGLQVTPEVLPTHNYIRG